MGSDDNTRFSYKLTIYLAVAVLNNENNINFIRFWDIFRDNKRSTRDINCYLEHSSAAGGLWFWRISAERGFVKDEYDSKTPLTLLFGTSSIHVSSFNIF